MIDMIRYMSGFLVGGIGFYPFVGGIHFPHSLTAHRQYFLSLRIHLFGISELLAEGEGAVEDLVESVKNADVHFLVNSVVLAEFDKALSLLLFVVLVVHC
jgi:hypothetical protein